MRVNARLDEATQQQLDHLTTATGKSVKFTLNCAPARGTQLMVVQNTGPGLIRGMFSNLAQGQMVTLNYRGVTYQFVAHYYGGSGKDLVLLWTNPKQSLPAATLNKLDNQLVLAVKQSRGDPPFDKPTTLRPEIYKYRGRVLVEIQGSLSRELSDQIASLGGQVVNDILHFFWLPAPPGSNRRNDQLLLEQVTGG